MKLFFSDCFQVSPEIISKYGALNISLVNDLPLFIDPFLLFNSKNPKYQKLHKNIIRYIVFLKTMSMEGSINIGLLKDWFTFPEVEENWLGFSVKGNKGHGLGIKFAKDLNRSLKTIFSDFGLEEIQRGSHLEKMCLVRDGIGRDNVSDFTANLIKDFLASYTQTFADTYLLKEQVKEIPIEKAYFNYETQSWVTENYRLPFINNSHILLVPLDILTKDEAWINRNDLIDSFERIAKASSNEVVSAKVTQYLLREIAHVERTSNLTKSKHKKIIENAIEKFPEIIDEYIDEKVENGDIAVALAKDKVDKVIKRFIDKISKLVGILNDLGFYKSNQANQLDLYARANILKYAIENKEGYKHFYIDDEPLKIDKDLQVIFRLIWFANSLEVVSKSDTNKICLDSEKPNITNKESYIRISLANNRYLKSNFEKFYAEEETAQDKNHLSIYIVMYFTDVELDRINEILKALKLDTYRNIILIDARTEDAKISESNQIKQVEDSEKLLAEKNDRIQALESMVNTALQQPSFYTRGDLNLSSDRNVNIDKGNYNENIKGNYLE